MKRMIVVADRIKYLREQKGLTQADLARQLGITRSSVNAWEMGISVPSTQYVVELANMFNVSTDYLLCVDKSATVGVEGLTEDDIQLVHTVIEHLREKNG
ncbi:MAG: helix-turn-helix transcriptional regulator [Paludibacteraceae bacterium]|nr:helix-turn-helix transcriptional regulator [Paludibacteraceae bacterium]